MPTFVEIDDRAGLLILAAVVIGVAFTVAPDQSSSAVENILTAIKGAIP